MHRHEHTVAEALSDVTRCTRSARQAGIAETQGRGSGAGGPRAGVRRAPCLPPRLAQHNTTQHTQRVGVSGEEEPWCIWNILTRQEHTVSSTRAALSQCPSVELCFRCAFAGTCVTRETSAYRSWTRRATSCAPSARLASGLGETTTSGLDSTLQTDWLFKTLCDGVTRKSLRD